MFPELTDLDYLKSIWLSLSRSEQSDSLILQVLGELLAQNVAMYEALQLIPSSISSLPAPVVKVPQAKVVKGEPDPSLAVLTELFVKSQSANQVVLDQIKQIIKSQPEDINRTTIMAGSPSSIKLQRDDGSLNTWDADGGFKVHVQNPAAGGSGLTDTQLRASPVSVSGPLTDTQLRASAVPVSTGLVLPGALDADGGLKTHVQNQLDIADRSGRIVGHVTIDNASLPVTGTFWQTTQPVSLATNTPDVTDRAARLLGLVSDKTAVTQAPIGNVSLGTSSFKTVVAKTGTLASVAVTADQVILTYTVTAGKTFYLQYFDVACRLTTFLATATFFGTVSLENPSGTKLWTMDLAGPGVVNTPVFHDISEAIPIAAASVIRVVCTPSATTAFTWRANFGGYEK